MKETVVSGIRSTGKLHIGNYYGAGASVLNWRENQYDLVLASQEAASVTL